MFKAFPGQDSCRGVLPGVSPSEGVYITEVCMRAVPGPVAGPQGRELRGGVQPQRDGQLRGAPRRVAPRRGDLDFRGRGAHAPVPGRAAHGGGARASLVEVQRTGRDVFIL